MNTQENILRFWAKTSKTCNTAFHPLICHMIDVAVVARTMWNEVLPSATKRRIAAEFGETDLDNPETINKIGTLVAFIAGLHDLGKCSPPFQLRGHNEKGKGKQTEKLLKIYQGSVFWQSFATPAKEAPHGYVTTVELPDILESCGFNKKIAEQISVLIGGHHGVFPNSDWRKNGRKSCQENLGDENWRKARIELTKILADLFDIKTFEQSETLKLNNGTVMILAGLVSVADWIGSDTEFFKCEISNFESDFELNPADYLKDAEEYAVEALEKLGWRHWTEYNDSKNFDELFPFEPRGLQTQAVNIAKDLTKQGIVVIESPMGEGKTEAAMFIADWLNYHLKQRGIYFALPTQATSNQMFGRVEKFLLKRFDKNLINLQLLHGHASLSAEFETLKENFSKIEGIYDECEGDNCVPQVVAAEWFTYRKRGLLAPFGVGTIDQALMAVLQTKHVFVRLFGLAHKTVIIDEVHAYDAYMSTLLERLLEWLAALGSPVILLSATLPKNRRNALIKAYQLGLGKVQKDDEIIIEGENKYPRISYSTDETIKVRHIETSTKTQTLHIEKIDQNFVEDLKEKLKNGGCAAIICNTVQRSQDMFELLANDKFFKDKIDLLHARFRFCDREEREKRVLQRFGKPDETGESPHRPRTAVLIATQIIEQSLDIDFDLMISDLAPIDLLLQRAGRLFRHDRKRPLNFDVPKLWIIKPPLDENGKLLADKNGLPDFGKAGSVYDKHILLRTWLTLQDLNQVEVPKNVENLIEQVYDLEKSFESIDERLVESWRNSLDESLRQIADNEKQAEYRYIKYPHYKLHLSGIFGNRFEEDSPEIHETLQALTRLTEPTVSVICLWEKDGRIFLDEDFRREINLNQKPYPKLTKELLGYSVGISNKTVVFQFFKEEAPDGWKESALLRHHRVLKFDENRVCRKFGHLFTLDKDLGLTIVKEEKNG